MAKIENYQITEDLEKLSESYFHYENIKGMIYKKERRPKKILLFSILTIAWIFFFFAFLPLTKLFPYLDVGLGCASSFVSWKFCQNLNYL